MKYFYLFLLTLSFNCYCQSYKNISTLKENLDYEYLSSSSTSELYYKIEKHSDIGNETYLWLKEVFKSKSHKYTLTYITISCDNKTYSIEDFITYNNKKIIDSGNKAVYHEKIFPDSIGEKLFNEICK